VVTVHLSGGSINSATIDAKTNGLDVLRYAGLGNRIQSIWPPKSLPTDHLPIDLKPIWMLGGGANGAPLRRTDEIKMIVVHNTGADSLPEAIIGPDIGTFTGNDPNHQIHYLMDLNGHVIKFMKDKTKANHAPGMWFGFDNVNGSNPHDSSIGIEVVHKEGPTEYTDDQYTVLPELIRNLQGAYGLDRSQIVGHSDVAVLIPAIAVKRSTPTHTVHADVLLLDGDRPMDPGQVFRWEKLEALGLGMVPQNSLLPDGAYSGLFDVGATVVLRVGDNDRHHQYGGKSLPHTAGKPIEDLQTDLKTIGYSLKVNGTFDNYTLFAVQAFQRHFFSGTRTRSAAGSIDRETAQMIKNVRG